jgi:RNA-directed DNA polymerase
MPKDAEPNGPAPDQRPDGAWIRVSGMQTKLHRWAAADAGRRFDDLFNLVWDPATLFVAFDRVAGNTGARSAGIDGLTVARITAEVGVSEFLHDIREALRDGSFRPQPVRERKIPKLDGTGRSRTLGIPTVADRVVQAALKLVLEPIFEADFEPVSYGFRPKRRAQDAIAEIHLFGTKGYRWVLDADIEAAFDNVEHTAVMDAVRQRVKDKRVLLLVKAFLKAGILTELGKEEQGALTGTPQGGILSPLIFNIAMGALDQRFHRDWKAGGAMATDHARFRRRRKGLPNWRLVRYADDFVIMVHGSADDVEALRHEVEAVLAPLGLRLSPTKTRIVNMAEGFDFLGFRIRWMPKRGSHRWHIYTFIGAKAIRALRDKIRALTRRTSQLNPRAVLIRLNQIMYGWASYFRHAVAKHTFSELAAFAWRRVVSWIKTKRRWNWTKVRQWLRGPHGTWQPIRIDGIELLSIAKSPRVTRYRYRGNAIPTPWALAE